MPHSFGLSKKAGPTRMRTKLHKANNIQISRQVNSHIDSAVVPGPHARDRQVHKLELVCCTGRGPGCSGGLGIREI